MLLAVAVAVAVGHFPSVPTVSTTGGAVENGQNQRLKGFFFVDGCCYYNKWPLEIF